MKHLLWRGLLIVTLLNPTCIFAQDTTDKPPKKEIDFEAVCDVNVGIGKSSYYENTDGAFHPGGHAGVVGALSYGPVFAETGLQLLYISDRAQRYMSMSSMPIYDALVGNFFFGAGLQYEAHTWIGRAGVDLAIPIYSWMGHIDYMFIPKRGHTRGISLIGTVPYLKDNYPNQVRYYGLAFKIFFG